MGVRVDDDTPRPLMGGTGSATSNVRQQYLMVHGEFGTKYDHTYVQCKFLGANPSGPLPLPQQVGLMGQSRRIPPDEPCFTLHFYLFKIKHTRQPNDIEVG